MAKVMDDGLKQRLIGAVVLLAIAVIFIPVLFDRNTMTPVDTSSQVPPMPNIVIDPMVVAEPPVVESPAPEPEAMLIPDDPAVSDIAAEQEAQAKQIAEQSLTNATASTVEENIIKPDAPSQAPTLNASGVPNGWLLQVISYSEEPKARSFRDQLIEQGYPAFVRKASTSKGVHFRVYIGPKLDRAEIVKFKREVDKAFQLNTWVVNMTPDGSN